MKPCVTPVLDDFDIGLMLLMYTLKSSKQKTTFVLVVISVLSLSLNSRLEGLVSCEDVQIVER